MTNINVNKQNQVQAQLLKKEVKAVETKNNEKVSQKVDELIRGFVTGEIPFRDFKQEITNLGAINFTVNANGQNAHIRFNIYNKEYRLKVPVSHLPEGSVPIEPRFFELRNNYNDLKHNWQTGNSNWSDNKKLQQLKFMKYTITDMLNLISPVNIGFEGYRELLTNDYIQWEKKADDITVGSLNCNGNLAHDFNEIEDFVDRIDSSEIGSLHPGAIIKFTKEQKIDLYKDKIDSCDVVIDRLNNCSDRLDAMLDGAPLMWLGKIKILAKTVNIQLKKYEIHSETFKKRLAAEGCVQAENITGNALVNPNINTKSL